MRRQIWGLIVLQWRLARNGFGSRSLLTMAALLAMGVVGAAFAAGAAVGMFLLAGFIESGESLRRLLLVDGIFAFFAMTCVWGLLIDVQRSDWLDLRRLLTLPVPPALVVGVNMALTIFSPMPLLFLFGTAGFLAGLRHQGLVGGGGVALGAAAYVAALCAWTYWIRGVVAGLLRNPRRRRLVLTMIPLATIAASQTPFLLSQWMGNGGREALEPVIGQLGAWRVAWGLADTPLETLLLWANAPLPPLWGAVAWWAALDGHPELLGGTVAALLLAASLGAWLAYRGALRQHREPVRDGGENRSRRAQGLPLTLRHFPGLGADTAALAAASFLSHLRHPQMRMLLIMPIFMAVMILVITRVGRDAMPVDNQLALPMFLLFWPYFNFSLVLYNQFGMDVGGFRALILLPVPRHRVFAAKNLALAPFVLGLGLLLTALGTVVLELEAHWIAFVLLHQAALFFLLCAVGNLVSVWMPYHIRYEAGSRPASRGKSALSGIIGMAITLALMMPALVCLGLGQSYGPGVGLGASAGLLALAALAYGPMLTLAGDQLAERELSVLDRLVRTREAGG